MRSFRLLSRWQIIALLMAALIIYKFGDLLSGLLRYQDDIVYLSIQHIKLVVYSSSFAIFTAVPIGVILSRPGLRRIADHAMQFFNIGSTVPTLAVLALSMTLLGIGVIPAIFALWTATLLPIVRNTYEGLVGVSVAMKEAAVGIGMTPMQVLFKVELPNAAFVIFAGVRTAIAVNVGTVPLAFLIGGGGLGELIFTGIDVDEPMMMLAGAIPTASLAIVFDGLIALLALMLIPKGVNPLRH